MLFPNLEELNYEGLLDQAPNVRRIYDTDLLELSKILTHEEDSDSYLTSPVYYAFTGRRGLWLYQKGQTTIPFCWHPNVEAQILVFPPKGEKNFSAIVSFLKELPPPPLGFLLARFKQEDIGALQRTDRAFFQGFISPMEEEVLDWKYPVRILSTEHVAKAFGGRFRRIRNRVRHIENLGGSIEDLTAAQVPELRGLAQEWASFKSSDGEDLLDLTYPYLRLLGLMNCTGVDLKGLIFKMQGRVQAVTMWDVSNRSSKTANMYVNLCSNELCVGLSDYAIKATADKLFSDGFALMNLGGSETAELDYFKAKFDPISSINIYSLEAKAAAIQETPGIWPDHYEAKRIAV